METTVLSRECGDPTRFLNFLRGMETRGSHRRSMPRFFFLNFLRGMETGIFHEKTA